MGVSVQKFLGLLNSLSRNLGTRLARSNRFSGMLRFVFGLLKTVPSDWPSAAAESILPQVKSIHPSGGNTKSRRCESAKRSSSWTAVFVISHFRVLAIPTNAYEQA